MKISLFSKKNQLDEMQEQTMRKIESRGFWLLWSGLLIAMVVQMISGAPARQMAGEWVVFMAGCFYALVECLRNGLWDRHLNDNPLTNALISLLAGAVLTVIMGLANGYWLGALILGVITGILCFAALQISSSIVRKRRKELDNPKDEEQ